MNRCPLTYELCGTKKYSEQGLRKLSHKLVDLKDLPFDAEGLRQEASARSAKMSIQGVQPKLSAVLNVPESRFDLVDIKGKFILKPQTNYPHLPENEDLTMHLASLAGMETPLHGLVYARDQSLVYFIQRFDRQGRSRKVHTEDFAQLAGETRHTKYNFSMERLIPIIEKYCTFPVIEKAEMFRRTIFNFLIGNEDMHLKNFSIIVVGDIVRLAPIYDFVNSTIVLRDPEEIALPIKGKKRGLTRKTLLDYFGQERLGLNTKVIDEKMQNFHTIFPQWMAWIDRSFLTQELKEKYKYLIETRYTTIGLGS